MNAVAQPRHASRDELIVRLQSDPAGVTEAPGAANPVVVIHVGRSVYIACSRAGKSHRGLSVHGDVDILPAGVPSRWELKESDMALIMSVPTPLLRSVAEQSGIDPDRLEIVNRFQARDRQIENIGWALKTEMEGGYTNGGLYLDSLATALAVHLLNHHSSASRGSRALSGGFAGNSLKRVLAYIEDNLSGDLSLNGIAAVAGVSVSHCKHAFLKSVGQPVHQYVIGRRVERARALLCDGEMPISQVALETGFAHQSHLAYHVRRILGVSPKSLVVRGQ